MAAKTPFKVKATLKITRTNNDILSREINLTNVIQDAALDYLSTEYGLTPAQVNNLVAEWRLTDILVLEPEV